MTTCFRCIRILSLPVFVTFPYTDSNFYRQVKHLYKVLYNSCTTLLEVFIVRRLGLRLELGQEPVTWLGLELGFRV